MKKRQRRNLNQVKVIGNTEWKNQRRNIVSVSQEAAIIWEGMEQWPLYYPDVKLWKLMGKLYDLSSRVYIYQVHAF